MSDVAAPHYRGIDSLRAIAVVGVILFHLDKRLLPAGYMGVDVFFVISGFVVSLSMARLGPMSLVRFCTHFYARRLLRIAPALIAMLLVATLATCLFIPPAWLSNANAKTGLAAFVGLSNLVLASPANDYFTPRAEFNPFTHTWSLGVEEQFYVVFPFIFFLFSAAASGAPGRRRAAWILVALSFASLLLCAWWTARHPSLAFYLMPARFWELGCGMALFMSRQAWQPRVRALSPRLARSAAAGAAVALLAALALLGDAAFPFPAAGVPVLITAALIAIVVARPEDVLPWPLTITPVLWLGTISYSLYLWHWPVFVLVRWTAGLDGPLPLLAAVAVTLGLATLSYRWIERPVRVSARIRSAPRWRVVVAGMAGVLATLGVADVLFESEQRLALGVTADRATWLSEDAVALPSSSPARCRVDLQWQARDPFLIESMHPRDCAVSRGKLLVAGDSHVVAYAGLLRLYAERAGRDVVLMREGGCAFLNLRSPVADDGPRCHRYGLAVLAELMARAEPGDALLLPSLRLDRLYDQWGGQPLAAKATVKTRRAAAEEAVQWLAPLAARGVAIVFEAPKPIFRSPAFRCADWFNRDQPDCVRGFHLDAGEFERVRGQALAAMRDVVRRLPGATLWDPTLTLCNATGCDAFRNGRPLFFDGDHLSGYGNAVLLDDFTLKMSTVFADEPH